MGCQLAVLFCCFSSGHPLQVLATRPCTRLQLWAFHSCPASLQTGDLQGCLYTFIDEYKCFENGIYLEKGRELFVGTYKGKTGSFRTTYTFEAQFEGCNGDGSPKGAEIRGRCQHPIVEGSGTGDFKGVTGRLDFIDDIKAGNFPYTGHLKF
jgi:hypothetical protein